MVTFESFMYLFSPLISGVSLASDGNKELWCFRWDCRQNYKDVMNVACLSIAFCAIFPCVVLYTHSYEHVFIFVFSYSL